MPKTKNQKKEVDTKSKTLEKVLAEIKEKFGEDAIMQLDGIRKVDVNSIPTGSIALDYALGVGGIPRGRIIEIYGAESSGKSTTALHIVAEAQKKGGNCAFIDAEHAMDPDYAKKIGVNTKDLLISQPNSGEEALQIVETLVKSNSMDVIVIDSVAALTPKAELEGQIGDVHMGRQARLLSQAMRKLTGIVSQTGTVVIFLNQTRMKIGNFYGSPITTPGGMALKFYSSIRIQLSQVAKINKKDEIIGSRIRAKVVKNKVAAPFKSVEFDIYWNEGISKTADIINTGLKYGIIKKSGSWFHYKDTKLGQGIDGAKTFLKEKQLLEKEIKKEIIRAMDKENEALI